MCSIGDDDFEEHGDAMIPQKPLESIIDEQLCKRCNQEMCVLKLSHKKDPECKNCFLTYVRHKFKAALGSTKMVKRDSTVLLVADNRPESVVMLDMIKYCLEQNIHQRLHVRIVGVLFINENFLRDGNEESELDFIRDIITRFDYLSMPMYYTDIGSSSDAVNILEMDHSQPINESSQLSVKKKLSCLESLTSQQEFIHNLRITTMKTTAKQLNAQYVFTPDISLDLAKTLLTNISLGRGASVGLDVAFCDNRHEPTFRIIRPMRDLTTEEVHHYLNLNNLTAGINQKFGEDKAPGMSIQNLTGQFVNDLQTKFCGTVSTVFKTGERLTGKTKDQKEVCRVCKSSLDYENSETLFAIEYSRLVSEYANQHNSDPEFIEEKAREAVIGNENSIRQKLCHSCRNMPIESIHIILRNQ
uniref:Cytoplasmic tRNA 2-thiolation protein 2 n=1 Tax=Culicoides sonorensis TaxID=179676 RepID=A0A336MKU2_CULSO